MYSLTVISPDPAGMPPSAGLSKVRRITIGAIWLGRKTARSIPVLPLVSDVTGKAIAIQACVAVAHVQSIGIKAKTC
jgi:hypothetical protein